jgi:hypothetical protein
MSKTVKDVTIKEKILTFNVTYKDEKSSNISINLENIKKDFVYQNIFFIGGNNIVFIIKINGTDYALRISFKSYIKKKCVEFIREMNMMHKLNHLKLGVNIYYPAKSDNIDDFILKSIDDTAEKYHTFSIIQYCKEGSVFQYINNKDYTLDNKKDKIDKLFDIIKKLIENNIFCYDIKFRNFVVDEKNDVKIIDIGDCYDCDYFKTDHDYIMIYKSIVTIQLFHNCPSNLIKYFTSKINFIEIYTSYMKLHDDNNIYTDNNYIILLNNLFWYYKKYININYENITEIIDISKLDKENKELIINKQFKEILTLKNSELYPFIKFYLFLIFSKIISYANDDDNKNIFYKYFYYYHPEPDIESESDDDSPFNCIITDGRKSIRRKSIRHKSIRRKSIRHKSIRRKSIRHKSIRKKK